MGTLWTPSGEHVPSNDEPSGAGGPTGGDPAAPGGSGGGPGEPGNGPDDEALEISAEQLEAIREMHARVRGTPAVGLLAEHAVALCEYALIYLGIASPPEADGRRPPPDLAAAGLLIDAAVGLVDHLGSRLAPHEEQLRQVINDVQRLYVEVADAAGP